MALIEGLLLALLSIWALLPDFWCRWESRASFRKGDASGNKVALTFDDGPDPVFTPRILGILAKRRVAATFFMVAENARKYPEIVREIVAGGHEVGSHGMHHSPVWFLSPRRSRLEIQESLATLQELTGKPVHCFRPPWGMSNLITYCWMRRAAQRVVLWSLDSLDWFFMTPARIIVKVVSRAVRPGSVILFHDGAGMRRTAAALTEALPQLLDNLLARGFIPVTVSELMDNGERMKERHDCWERRDESFRNSQAPGVLHCCADQRGFMGRPEPSSVDCP